jgi:hypothetical protein
VATIIFTKRIKAVSIDLKDGRIIVPAKIRILTYAKS